MSVTIRTENATDIPAIRRVHLLAFGQDAEGKLVDDLRVGGFSRVSLVAESDREVVGHVLFSDLPIQSEAGITPALSLAPVVVLPQWQRQGIGQALIRRGLAVCRQAGHGLVVVLGHVEYYPRFGFSPELARKLESPFPGDSFMALELVPGALRPGKVCYPAPFGVFL